MDISIIIPYYKGKKYLDRIERNLKEYIFNIDFKHRVSFEIIMINDSPSEPLELTEWMKSNIRLINNEVNKGIHYSRVEGLKAAHGKYIQFMDQDDSINFKELEISFLKMNKLNIDVIINNGKLEFFDGTSAEIYTTSNYKKSILIESNYLNVRDLIISPGQCLIKKDSIPESWQKNIMHISGTDDYLLWLLMFNENRLFKFCDNVVYIHKNSGENLSLDIKNWKESLIDLEYNLSIVPDYPVKKIKRLHRLNLYKLALANNNRVTKVIESVKNVDLLIINVIFRILNGPFAVKIRNGNFTPNNKQ